MSVTASRSVSRRVFVQGTVLTVAGASVAGLSACSTSSDQPEPLGYDGEPRALPIPPVEEGTMDGDTRVFKLTAQDGHSEVLPGKDRTRTWGFNGPFLGPTLRARRGDKIRAEITNDLIEMTTVHWHGMQLPAYSDGGPHSPIQVGETWKPEWGIIQPAATVWYHPHPHLATATHAYRGLAGMFIIDDDVSDSLDLPHEYGVDDIPVVIMDAKFTEDDQFDEKSDNTLGLLGTTPVVNGITNARFEATTRRVRLRLLNGASMRFYTLEVGEKPFHVIATDAGLLDAPVEVDSLLLGPGERAEVIVDLEPGKDIQLRSVPRKDNFGVPTDDNAADFGFRDSFDLLTIVGPEESAPEPAALPATLDRAAGETPSTVGLTEREFILNTFMINGEQMDMARVDTVIDEDALELWTVTNENSDWPHNFHIHNARFKVVDWDGDEKMNVFNSGWKDIVNLPPKATARLLVEFGHFPDKTIPYMYHCHMLLHEDQGMMGQYVIVDKGEKPDVRVKPGALVFDKDASGHAGHASQVVDSSRSPYASPEATA
ncbi:multicopper oxidase family protein [Corynebacterium sp. HMSC078H07]|uniref:multicopper oxidase family protein n=1 Tax=Corynebacterium sp. HMSC078H07 TaxID=1739379 RepID=UPI0008A40E2B|nr:multicopper oxidase domain-containing protein [Corynebacterium sp. HMSC078H07]OFR67357.1 copper oxidase [Corynebacterium sp. HMSC078H07]